MTEAQLLYHYWEPLLKVAFKHTRHNQREQYPNDTAIVYDRFIMFWTLKYSMTVSRFPAKEDFWKGYSIGPITYPNYGNWMSQSEFEYIEGLLRFTEYTVEKAIGDDKMWKVREIFNVLQKSIRETCPRFAKDAVVDEIRFFFSGRGPCLKVMRSKPIEKGWTLWAAACCETGVLFDIYIWDTELTKENCAHLPWGMRGEVLLRFVRRHAPPGSIQPYYGHGWVSDNWFSRPEVIKEMERLKQGYTATWTKNGGAPPEVMFGKSRKPSKTCPKGSMRCVVMQGKPFILGWGYMDSAKVAVMDNQKGGKTGIISRNKRGEGEADHIGPECINMYTQTMHFIDDVDLLRASKHGRYSMELYGKQCKWTIRFVEGCFDTASAQALKVFENVKAYNNIKTRRSHHQFISLAIQGMIDGEYKATSGDVNLRSISAAVAEKQLRNKAVGRVAMREASSANKDKKSNRDNSHMHYAGKTNEIHINPKREMLKKSLENATTTLMQQQILDKMKKTSKFLRRRCRQCENETKKTAHGCLICGIHLHMDPECWDTYHMRLHSGEIALVKNDFKTTTRKAPKSSPIGGSEKSMSSMTGSER